MKHFHYIFTGAGLAALMTVYEMVRSGKFAGKSILLLDGDTKKTNDRTWCFWEEHGGEFDKIVSRKWDAAWFKNADSERLMDLQPYRYKMVRGVDFYDFILGRISAEENITFLNQKVTDFSEVGTHAVVKTETEAFTCNKIFNSIYNPALPLSQKKYPVLQQHFTGWFVKSTEATFNPKQATFMDFSVEQRGNTRFMYVLPLSENEALVEYTLFSKELLPAEEYETEIRKYIQNLGITDYEILETEHGSIPMTGYPFWKNNSENLIHIGSAGGWTKASTGYTFRNTTRKSKELVQFLQQQTDFRKFHKTNKFRFYDLLLLDILARNNEKGSEIFSALFQKGNPALILKFLDEQTSFSEDIQVILKCPKRIFLQALLRRLLP